MSKWPRDNQAELIRFFGNPGTSGPGSVRSQMIPVIPPFKMYYEGKLLKSLSFHRKGAPALLSVLNKVWDYYDNDQSKIDALGISKTAGTWNPRKVRGSKTKWSSHAFGTAIDINAEQNGFNVAGNIPLPMIAAFKSEGFRWGGNYKSRKDPMHFELIASGEPERTFEEWLEFYKVSKNTQVSSALDDPNGGMEFAGTETLSAKSNGSESETAMDYEVTPTGNFLTSAKSLFKSKIAWILGLLGVNSASDLVNNAQVIQIGQELLTSPRFYKLIGLVALVGVGLYFYWRDHGKGSEK